MVQVEDCYAAEVIAMQDPRVKVCHSFGALAFTASVLKILQPYDQDAMYIF